jgi:hypothetical protein
MARLMFAVVAERVSVDRFSNILDVHNVIEQLQVPEPAPELLAKARAAKKPAAVPIRFAMLLHWRRANPAKAEGLLRQRVQFLSPDGTVISSAEMDFHLRQAPYVRNVVWFNALPLAGEGTYTFRIAVKVGKQWRAAGDTSYELSYQKLVTGQRMRLQ